MLRRLGGGGCKRLRGKEEKREGGGEREISLYYHQHTQAAPPGYMFSPGAYQASTTPTFMEDLEDPNPPVDPETVNREFYQLDKVRERVL